MANDIITIGGGSGTPHPVEFYTDFASFPASGQTDIIYVDKATGDQYVWDGAMYIKPPSGATTNVITINQSISGSTTFANTPSSWTYNAPTDGILYLYTKRFNGYDIDTRIDIDGVTVIGPNFAGDNSTADYRYKTYAFPVSAGNRTIDVYGGSVNGIPYEVVVLRFMSIS